MTSEGSASAISNELWSAALMMLEPDHSKPVFEMFLKPMRILSLEQTEFVMATPTAFARDWAENHLKNSIHAALHALTGFNGFTLRFVIAPEGALPALEHAVPRTPAPPVQEPIIQEEPAPQQTLFPPQELSEQRDPLPQAQLPTVFPQPTEDQAPLVLVKPTVYDEIRPNNLNPRYTFEEFVVGTFNSFAHAAALAVADAPARAYNPLFLYGGVGLGKTHLMHAIGHRVLLSNPQASVVYVSSEKFTNDFILGIKNNQAVEFRAKYRHVDILMIDDIQFLEGKEQTQEEFFHTFNTLHEASRQIIISSDRPPKEIQTLENRLRSRFEWGLLIDVQPPDLETREAILRKKAESEKLPVPDEVTSFIAKTVVSNIRELEGALIRVVAFASLSKAPITTALAAEVLKNVVSVTPRRITIGVIKETVAKAHGLTLKEIDNQRRDKRIAGPRQIAMYLAAELTDSSLPQIAREFQKKDHTTVMYARDRVKEQMTNDESYRDKVLSLAALCESE